jgi:AcrR family transcriptional regulator
MSKKNISQEKIIQSFLSSSFNKSAGSTSLADIADDLEIKKASLYNHFSSKEEMYDSTIQFCKTEIASIPFLTEKTLASISANKTSISVLFKRLISKYFNLFENEPLFQMYTFIHSEKYYNLSALQVVTSETEKLTNDIKQIICEYIKINKIAQKSEKELKELSSAITSIILNQLDSYIAEKKETVRQNPESGAGSLFALPTDEKSLNKTTKIVESICNLLSIE